MNSNLDNKIGLLGVGYVGLALAMSFSKKYSVFAYDLDVKRINDLNNFIDVNEEYGSDEIKKRIVKKNELNLYEKGLYLTKDFIELKNCNFYIIAVPTNIDQDKNMVLDNIISASTKVSKVLKKGDYVIYESTVFPGTTEDICCPILEKNSKLKLNEDFFLGYSPERYNPADKSRSFESIKKVISGSSNEAGLQIEKIYNSVLKNGTFFSKSIKVAEMSKLVENTQRDIGIAFTNEIAKICNHLKIDTKNVLNSASSKWNFISFKPGLVGGGCITKDPYILLNISKKVGYESKLIGISREINDSMGNYIADIIVKTMLDSGLDIKKSNLLILGFTYKKNSVDARNSRVLDLVERLKKYDLTTVVFDPLLAIDIKKTFTNISFINTHPKKLFDVIIISVAHNAFKKLDIKSLKKTEQSIIFDVTGDFIEATHSL